MYGDDDLDSVLLGGGLNPVHDAFDPFATGIGEGDGDSDSDDGDTDSAIIYDYGDTFGRFSGGYNEAVPTDGESLLGPGPKPSTTGADEQRERAATDAGIGNVRRVADERGGNPGTGVARRTRSEGVASSIGQAAQRIRAEASIPLTDDERRAGVNSLGNGTQDRGKIKRTYTRSIITEVPTFRRSSFEAMLMGLKANTNGDWIIQLKVPNEFTTEATSLGQAYGLALDISITRKIHGSGN